MAWVLALGTSLGVVNYLVDPSGLFYRLAPGKPALCSPDMSANARALKPYAFVASTLRTLALGTSQVEIGIDVSDPYLVSQTGPAFNLALPGAEMRTMAGLGIEAMSHSMVDTIVVGLSYGMFESDQREGMEAPKALNPGLGTIAFRLRALFAPAFTKTALRSVFLGCQTPIYRLDGQVHPEIYVTSVWANPSKAIREEMPDGYLKQYMMKRKGTADAGRSPYSANLQALREMVDTAVRTHTRLVMFVTPLSAPILEIIRQTGHQEGFERWKRDLGDLAGTRDMIAPVRDFSVHSKVTDEPFPVAASSSADLHWFFELNHFSPALGALVLKRLFQENGEGELFGAPLEPGTIDAHLAAARSAGEAYRATHPQEVAWIERRAAILRRAGREAR